MDPLQLSTSMNEDADENTMDMPSQSPETVIPTKRVKRKTEISPSISDPTVQNKPTSSTSHLSSIDQELSEAMKCFQKVCKAREERQKNGALQGFRQMIISTISNMSAAKQTKAILRVTEAVMQIKMEPED